MAKQTGLGDNLYIGGVDVSGDTQALGSVHGGPAAMDVTGIDKSGYERIGGVRDGSFEFTTFFNPTGEHVKLSTLPTADDIATYTRGTTSGAPAACIVFKQANYDGTRAQDGMFTFSVQALSNAYGIEWGKLATPGMRTDTTATTGSGVDLGAASSFGLQAYLHVFAFTGTSATVKLQGSSDNGVGDAYADITGGSFTVVTSAPYTQRIATASNLAVEQYVRVVTTGTFSDLKFAVVVVRNETSVVF